MSLISFIGLMHLHFLFVFIYHRYKNKHRHTPFCPKNALVPGREERISRSASATTVSGEHTLTHEFVKHASRQALNRSASYRSLSAEVEQALQSDPGIPLPPYAVSQDANEAYGTANCPPAPRQARTATFTPVQTTDF